jgi:hypothetical protein
MCVRDIEKGAIVLPWDRQVFGEWNHLSLHMKSEMFHSISSFT